MQSSIRTVERCTECTEPFLLVAMEGRIGEVLWSAEQIHGLLRRTCCVCEPCLTRLYGDEDARDA
jgi:hypothetical protein